LPDSTQEMLEAYSNGINAFIHTQQTAPAVEFQILSYLPKDWEPVHTLAIWRLWGWLNSSLCRDLLDILLTIRISENHVKTLNIDSKIQIPKEIQPSFLSEGYKILAAFQKLDALTGFPCASNFTLSRLWGKTNADSSLTLLSFSPLSRLTIPNSWYLIQTTIHNSLILGATIPGIPIFFSGTNGKIAWGVEPIPLRNSYFQLNDFRSMPDNNSEFQIKQQVIPINRQDTLKIPVYRKNGQPILYSSPDNEDHRYFLTCDWTGLKSDSLFIKLLNIGAIHSLQLIRSDLPENITPAIQFLAIDTNDSVLFLKFGASFEPANSKKMKRSREAINHIAYEMKSFFNHLTPESYHLQFPYTNFQSDSVLNLEPEFGREIWQEFFQTAADPDSADLLKLEFVEKNLTYRFSSSAAQILPIIINYLEQSPDSAAVKVILYLLKHWDYYEHPYSYAATVFNLIMERLISEIFHDEMGDSLYSFFIQSPEFLNKTMTHLLHEPANIWFDIQKPDTVKEMLSHRLIPIITQLYSSQNPDASVPNFLWKSQTPCFIHHLLATIQSRDFYLNSEMVYLQGNGFPLNAISQISNPSASIKGWPLQIIFMPTDPIQVFWVMSTGQSGHILSPDYKNLTRRWLEGKFYNFNFTDKKVNEKNKIVIIPQRTIGAN